MQQMHDLTADNPQVTVPAHVSWGLPHINTWASEKPGVWEMVDPAKTVSASIADGKLTVSSRVQLRPGWTVRVTITS